MFTTPPSSLTQLSRDPKDFLVSPDPGMKHIKHCMRMAQVIINGEHSTLITTCSAARGSIASSCLVAQYTPVQARNRRIKMLKRVHDKMNLQKK